MGLRLITAKGEIEADLPPQRHRDAEETQSFGRWVPGVPARNSNISGEILDSTNAEEAETLRAIERVIHRGSAQCLCPLCVLCSGSNCPTGPPTARCFLNS